MTDVLAAGFKISYTIIAMGIEFTIDLLPLLYILKAHIRLLMMRKNYSKYVFPLNE